MKLTPLIDKTRRVNPKTKAMLVTLEPTTFPTIIPPLFSIAANRVVSISGAEVPKAITVDPIKKGESPKFFETNTEYFSNFPALIQTSTTPGIRYKNKIDTMNNMFMNYKFKAFSNVIIYFNPFIISLSMQMKLKKILIAVIFLILNLSSGILYAVTPHETADKLHENVISFIRNNENLYKENKEEFINNIDVILDPVVDFRRIARGVMGKYYKQSTDSQRKEFFKVFRSTLLKTYTDTFVEFKNARIDVLPLVEDSSFGRAKLNNPNRGKVEVKIITETTVYPATYSMYRDKKGEWRITNIVVNGVNLGLTFRNQFYSLSEKRNANIDLVIKEWIAAL